MNRIVRYKNDDEADMGIGTLILFIAMVLVAAVAAGVLISTAGSLQQQAQETGTLAEQEVSSGFVTVAVLGDCDDSNPDQIDDLYLKLRLNAGSPAIDMDNVIIEIQNKTGEANLQMDNDGYVEDATHYSVEAFTDDNTGVIRDPEGLFGVPSTSTDQHIVSQGTLLLVHIDAAAALGGSGIAPQDHVNIKIIPKHGAPTYETFNTPECYADDIIELA